MPDQCIVQYSGGLDSSVAAAWEGYSLGFQRTACWCCPGLCGLQALALQENYPHLAHQFRLLEAVCGPHKPLSYRWGRSSADKSLLGRTFDDEVAVGRRKAKR